MMTTATARKCAVVGLKNFMVEEGMEVVYCRGRGLDVWERGGRIYDGASAGERSGD